MANRPGQVIPAILQFFTCTQSWAPWTFWKGAKRALKGSRVQFQVSEPKPKPKPGSLSKQAVTMHNVVMVEPRCSHRLDFGMF